MRLIPPAVLRLYMILPALYRRKLIFSSLSVFVMACVDLIGLGVLLPVLLLIMDKNSFSQNHFLSLIYTKGGFESDQALIVAVCLVIFIISLGRTVFNTYMQYNQNKRLFEISNYLSVYMYQLYYSKGFLYIKQNNSHRIINQINAITTNLIQGYFVPFTSLICEIVVVVAILIGLILFNWYVFMIAFLTFVPLSVSYYIYSRSRVKKYGERLFHIMPEKNRILQQTFVGYTDMEMSNSFSTCKKLYTDLLNNQNYYHVRNAVLNTTLQRILEFAVVCSVIALIIATQLFQLPSLGVIIGMFVIAVYRILPGIIKGTSYYFQMRGNSFALDFINNIEKLNSEKDSLKQQKISFKNTIRFDSVSFSYDKSIPVIQNLSLEIKKGDFIGIKGESGSGKSTLFHLLLGFLQPDSGSIYIDDKRLTSEYMDSWHSKIGYVSQQLFMVEGTLLDNIVMSSKDISPDYDRIYQVLKLASLDSFVETLPQGLNTFIGEGGCLLSGGQRQRLGIARALYKNMEILLFDEATSSLDEGMEKTINQAIVYLAEQRCDLTILIISHRPESLSICRKIFNITEMKE